MRSDEDARNRVIFHTLNDAGTAVNKLARVCY
jgi:hypothetical protein